MTYRVRVATAADAEIQEAATWWLANRPAALEAFGVELDRVVDLLRTFPEAGQPYEDAKQFGVRRVLLERVRYHLYYVPVHEEETLVVLSLWHSSRGEGPLL